MLPERHRDLIEQTRAANRRSQAKAKPVPNRIGDRDPVTGQHSAIYPDGSETAAGRKLYDAHATKGDAVTGLAVGDGTIGLLGPKGERSALAAPEKEGVRGLTTAAPLQTKAVGYLRGQVWSYEEPEQEKTGKIKYIYSVANADGSKDLWLGGWQPKPVKIKAIAPEEYDFVLRNTGGDRYFLDVISDPSDLVTSFTNQGEVYRYNFSGFEGGVFLRGYSFASGNGGSGLGYWTNLFQGVFRGGANTDAYGKVYLLPNLLSPTGEINDGRNFLYLRGAINQSGTRGVGSRVDIDPITFVQSYQVAIYSADGIVDTGVSPTFDTSFIDCFDESFSVIDPATLSTDILSKPKFTGTIGIYGFDAIQQRTVKTTIYGIPAAQRSAATLIGRPSYHPKS